jgi:lysozyme
MFDGIIDLSHNNDADLSAIQEAGIVAIIHKATEGATYQDPMYASRRTQAGQLGLLWGAYHFGTAAPVDQQVANFVKTAQPGPNDLVALDYETNTGDPGNQMTLAQAEEFIETFYAQYGYRPLIYGSDLLTAASSQTPPSSLGQSGLWIAAYTSAAQPSLPSLFSSYQLWQYTDGTSPVPCLTAGVACDRSRFNGTQAQLEAAWPMR